jgi:hypothetical protein
LGARQRFGLPALQINPGLGKVRVCARRAGGGGDGSVGDGGGGDAAVSKHRLRLVICVGGRWHVEH